VMAGLSCGETSLLAWPIIKRCVDFFMTIPDAAAEQTMRLLADARYGDRALVGGESGVAGLAGFLAVADDEALRATLRVDTASRILVFGTEGDTDPDCYQRIVGGSAQQVRDDGGRAH